MNNKTISEFDLSCIGIMTSLLESGVDTHFLQNAISDLHLLKLTHAQLLEKINLLQEQVNIDQKTGLLKYKDDYLENTIKTASRTLDNTVAAKKFSIGYVRFDIDDFRDFNTKYGHETGDNVLRQVAHSIRESSRPTDICIRFGGEEFDVLLPATPVEGVKTFLEKIYKNIGSTSIYYGNEDLKVTVSAGVSVMSLSLTDMRSKEYDANAAYLKLQHEADDALYAAKFEGKKKYCIYDGQRKDYYDECRAAYFKL